MDTTLYGLGVALVFAGIAIMGVSLVIFVLRFKTKSRFKGGGIIMIGPFPIVFGTDAESTEQFLLLSIILTVLAVTAMVALHLFSN